MPDLNDLTSQQRDSYAMLRAVLINYGLEGTGLTQQIFDYLVQGYSADTINLLIQDTDAWKQRFAANEIRRANGMSVLSVDEYIRTEDAYRQILSSNGLPIGFYDQLSDFTNFLAKDMSPSELQKRVDLAVQKTTYADPTQKAALSQFYGVDEAGIVAYFLDETRALPLLQKQAESVGIGSEAMRRGLATSRARAEELYTFGITADKAGQGYANVDEILLPTQRLAALSRMGYTQTEAENEVFGLGLGAEAGRKRKRLVGEEMARFAGAAGVTAGAFGRSTVGQF
jgi:hypothetical protein